MAKAIIIVLLLAVAGGLGGTCFQLAERLSEQETQVTRLRHEIEALRDRQAEPPAAAASIDPASFDLPAASDDPVVETVAIPDEELRALVGRLVADEAAVGALARRVEGRIDPSSALLGSSAFRDGVRTTMDEIREEERQRQMAEREERMWERTEERAREIATRLNLPAQTAEELTQIILGSAESRQEMFALVRDGEIPREDVRLSMRQQRDETNAKIQTLLTPTEYAEYQKIEAEMGPGGPGGRGGRGFGGEFQIAPGFGQPPAEATPATPPPPAGGASAPGG